MTSNRTTKAFFVQQAPFSERWYYNGDCLREERTSRGEPSEYILGTPYWKPMKLVRTSGCFPHLIEVDGTWCISEHLRKRWAGLGNVEFRPAELFRVLKYDNYEVYPLKHDPMDIDHVTHADWILGHPEGAFCEPPAGFKYHQLFVHTLQHTLRGTEETRVAEWDERSAVAEILSPEILGENPIMEGSGLLIMAEDPYEALREFLDPRIYEVDELHLKTPPSNA